MATGFGDVPWENAGSQYTPHNLGGVGEDLCGKQQGDTKTPEPTDECTPPEN